MTYSIKAGSPLKREPLIWKIKKYIKHSLYIYNQRVLIISEVIQLRNKTKQILAHCINITVTGGIIYYIVNESNLFVYGLATGLVMYYISWFVKLVKTPYEKM